MTTLATLADQIQETINDTAAATWSQSQIEQWLNDAIEDYSRHFKRLMEQTVSVSAGTQKYALAANVQELVQVEYPDAQDPPEYLQRRDSTRDDFWDVEGYYDIRYLRQDSDTPDLLISWDEGSNGTLRYWYLAAYDSSLASAGTIDVPDEHWHILELYVIWKCYTMLALDESKAPTSNSSLLMAQLNQNARNAWWDYRRTIVAAQQELSASHVRSWQPGHLKAVY